jgi:hypothetical protein
MKLLLFFPNKERRLKYIKNSALGDIMESTYLKALEINGRITSCCENEK